MLLCSPIKRKGGSFFGLCPKNEPSSSSLERAKRARSYVISPVLY
ncbi:MAG: hypothetical protein U5L45_13415 [Saprospiraceae bacterium]|nr:hypothetical protein [Saprospiraceae bacterium]